MNYQNISLSLFFAFALNGTSLAMKPEKKKNQPNKTVDFFLAFEGLKITEKEVPKNKSQNNQNNNCHNNNKNNAEIRKLKEEENTSKIVKNIPIEKFLNKKKQAIFLEKSVEKPVVKNRVLQKEQSRVEVDVYCCIGKKNKMSGIYYRDEDGELFRILKSQESYDGYSMMNNHLSDLDYSNCRKMLKEDDFQHNFDQSIEEDFGHKAHVFIENDDLDQILDGSEELDLRITLPGKMDTIEYKKGKKSIIESEQGVFEFAVRKSLYQQEGVCLHRFFNTKNGEFGAEGFGVAFREEEERRLNDSLNYYY